METLFMVVLLTTLALLMLTGLSIFTMLKAKDKKPELKLMSVLMTLLLISTAILIHITILIFK